MNFKDTKHEVNPVWIYPREEPHINEMIVTEFNIHPVTAQVLISRGFTTKEVINSFLYAKLPNLFPPHLFADIEKATERIHQALTKEERILVYGDNDVDGITGTTLLTDFLYSLGGHVFPYVPNRNSLRNSTIVDAMEFALVRGCTLIITVDCGITAANEIEEVAKQGIDVIITDHHEPTDKIPHCVATLNPKLLNSTYPNRDLTGVGVAFKLAHAMINFLIAKGEIQANFIDLKSYLDLVAVGTIADMGALHSENRILVRYGLQQLRKTTRIGLQKLIEVCDIRLSDITTTDIASKVAPRINSLGRIDDPKKGIELLLIKDEKEGETLAQELDMMNQERQKIERRDSEEIEEYLIHHPEIFNEKAIVLYSHKWHSGIIAIISARIAKQYNRPTIIITIENGIGKGSIRTIPEFPVLGTLKQQAHLLLNYGGHDYAAGLTIKEENIEAFKKAFIAKANEKLGEQDVTPKLYIDSLVSFKDLTFEFLESLNLLEPYGSDNPQAILYCYAKQVLAPRIVGKRHLKFYLEESDRFLEGIGFNMAHRKADITKKNLKLLIAFTPQVNLYLNKSSIQLQIRDFQIVNITANSDSLVEKQNHLYNSKRRSAQKKSEEIMK
jgi:single-stranded-DNA-specific exonuclease